MDEVVGRVDAGESAPGERAGVEGVALHDLGRGRDRAALRASGRRTRQRSGDAPALELGAKPAADVARRAGQEDPLRDPS